MRSKLEKIYMGIIFVFMYAPILTLIILSFNSSKSRARWGGFTFQWYINLINDNSVLNAMANTLIIALVSTVFATVIGTLTCVGLMGLKRRSRTVIMGITNIPMINADIVTGISLMLLFKVMRFETGFITVTHRIIRITPEGYIFKGDHNSTEDTDPVKREQILYRLIICEEAEV